MHLIRLVLVAACVALGHASATMDVGVGAFSPDGSLYQIEYACAAAERGDLAVGVEAAGAVVLACVRPAHNSRHTLGVGVCPRSRDLSSSGRGSGGVSGVVDGKLAALGPSLGCVASGLLPDARVLVALGRTTAANHWFTFGTPMAASGLAASLGDAARSFSNHARDEGEEPVLKLARPMGAQLLVAGVDTEDGDQDEEKYGEGGGEGGGGLARQVPAARRRPRGSLHLVTPDGSSRRWRAKAVGTGSAEADAHLSASLQHLLDAHIRAAAAGGNAGRAPCRTPPRGGAGAGDGAATDRAAAAGDSAPNSARAAATAGEAAFVPAPNAATSFAPSERDAARAAVGALLAALGDDHEIGDACGGGGGSGGGVAAVNADTSAGGSPAAPAWPLGPFRLSPRALRRLGLAPPTAGRDAAASTAPGDRGGVSVGDGDGARAAEAGGAPGGAPAARRGTPKVVAVEEGAEGVEVAVVRARGRGGFVVLSPADAAALLLD